MSEIAEQLCCGRSLGLNARFRPGSSISFVDVEQLILAWALHIENRFDSLANVLLDYESFHVVQDEIARTLDLCRNLRDNCQYFNVRAGGITVFLPRNQPIYAFACFVAVPSLMASEVSFRIPHAMRFFFSNLLEELNVRDFFPNVFPSLSTRNDFLRERTANYPDSSTGQTRPVTDVVIFTGSPAHADQLRRSFDFRSLFIANGAGHNPVVVGADADAAAAAAGVTEVAFYNQGQDCGAPSTILVNERIHDEFLHHLRCNVSELLVGSFHNRENRIGRIGQPADLVRVQELLIKNRRWLDRSTAGNICARDAILYPTIVVKPLSEGGNFGELFAPIVFVQRYDTNTELANYFEHARHARHAMYLTLYGSSPYVDGLVGRPIAGKVLHDHVSILRNTHLHAPGVERGIKPYGGLGSGASSISINRKITCMPTLPQRDIWERVGQPVYGCRNGDGPRRQDSDVFQYAISRAPKPASEDEAAQPDRSIGQIYIDTAGVAAHDRRYVHVDAKHVYELLRVRNDEYVASLDPVSLEIIRLVRDYISGRNDLEIEPLNGYLQNLLGRLENGVNKRELFVHFYHLLFGKPFGPRLALFLLDADRAAVCDLLNV